MIKLYKGNYIIKLSFELQLLSFIILLGLKLLTCSTFDWRFEGVVLTKRSFSEPRATFMADIWTQKAK